MTINYKTKPTSQEVASLSTLSYLITSINYPEQIYIGYIRNVNEHLTKHNNGGSVHTAKYKPWQLITYLGFANKTTALEFEKYLKS